MGVAVGSIPYETKQGYLDRREIFGSDRQLWEQCWHALESEYQEHQSERLRRATASAGR